MPRQVRPTQPGPLPRQPWPPTSQPQPQATAPNPPPTRVRAQDADTPPRPAAPSTAAAPPALNLPPPEQLGVSTAKIAAYPTGVTETVDWNAVHFHLRRLGAVAFQLVRADDHVRVTFLLPTGERERTQRIEVTSASEAEAVRLALEKADQFAK